MKEITLSKLIAAYAVQKYVWFNNGDWDFNLFGVRSAERIANSYDDLVGIAYKVDGRQQFHVYPATTDPGLPWLQKPMQVQGCGIMAPGQYRGAYSLGTFMNRPALIQVGPVSYYRDNNRDNTLDFDAKTLESAVVGAHVHCVGGGFGGTPVGFNSAMCQDLQLLVDMQHLYDTLKEQVKRGGKTFTYTLFTEDQI